MRTGVKVGGFALGLAVLFGAAYLAGGAFGTEAIGRPGHGAGEHAAAGQEAAGHGAAGHGAGTEGHDTAGHDTAGHEGHAVAGLAVTDQGYTLRRLSPDPAAGAPAELAFQIVGPGGRPVTSFVNTHEKPLHLIIARRDLSGFQHLHPTRDAAGTWRVPATLPAAGDYRLFTDFVPDGRTDTIVLGTDLTVAGDYRPVPLPPPAAVSTVDGYTVRLLGNPGQGSVRFDVSLAGLPVTDLQPYLAAYGHLVALRQGDLGYLHVHPDGGPGVSPPGPEIAFSASLPPAGVYRLYLQFAHRGRVHTAEFTVNPEEVP
ncbi:MAG TPA: hypothetical protein VL595_04205 [Pseudonocardia sp.]|jgi:hypothetical protein|nr:hypothetical protein [Pseudonocardia sp.]